MIIYFSRRPIDSWNHKKSKTLFRSFQIITFIDTISSNNCTILAYSSMNAFRRNSRSMFGLIFREFWKENWIFWSHVMKCSQPGSLYRTEGTTEYEKRQWERREEDEQKWEEYKEPKNKWGDEAGREPAEHTTWRERASSAHFLCCSLETKGTGTWASYS